MRPLLVPCVLFLLTSCRVDNPWAVLDHFLPLDSSVLASDVKHQSEHLLREDARLPSDTGLLSQDTTTPTLPRTDAWNVDKVTMAMDKPGLPLDTKTPPAPNCNGGWCSLPKGTFSMGSDAKDICRDPLDETQHDVVLTHDLLLQQYETTRGQYKQRMGYDPTQVSCSSGPPDSCPVSYLSWHEAAAYCNELSKSAGISFCYTCLGKVPDVTCSSSTSFSTCSGYRLPTEAEWEYAYRAGAQSPLYTGASLSFCTSDTIADPIAWYTADSGKYPHSVGTRQPNSWGLHDMAGNVAEWTSDGYLADLGIGGQTDPWSIQSSGPVTVRNGSYSDPTAALRAASRKGQMPSQRDHTVGFRCVRPLP